MTPPIQNDAPNAKAADIAETTRASKYNWKSAKPDLANCLFI